MKPVVLRQAAQADVDAAIAQYLMEGIDSVALRFLDQLEKTFARIRRHPASGSPRYAHELDIPWLRVLAVARFPFLVFYVEHAKHVEIWRVLHSRRDVAAWLQEDNDS